MKNRGYTLVELLVVVAIIAILAAMIMPVLLQAKESARMRCCLVDMKQLGGAITRYIDDHNGYGLPPSPPEYKNPWILCVEPLIPAYVPGSLKSLKGELPVPGNGNRVSGKIQPKRIWICPGDVNRGSEEVDSPYWWNCGSSYLYPGPAAYLSGKAGRDEFLKDHDGAGKPFVPRKVSLWANPRRDILLADYWYDFHTGLHVEHEFTGTFFPSTMVPNSQMKNINVLFLDMHAQSVTAAQREEYRTYTVEVDNPYSGECD